MCQGYVLEWLDMLISVPLNPIISDIGTILLTDIEKLNLNISREKEKVQTAIKSTVFNLHEETAIRSALKKYHSSLISLLDQALENRAQAPKDQNLIQILDNVVSCIEELLLLIEKRFTNYLDIEERIPTTSFLLMKKDVVRRLNRVATKHRCDDQVLEILNIIINDIEILLKRPSENHNHTFREMFYIKDLCWELECCEYNATASVLTELDSILIRMNFNSKAYIYKLTQKIADHINMVNKADEKMERLLYNLKIFKQHNTNPDTIFMYKRTGLFEEIDNWFSQEILYLEKKIHYSILPMKESHRTAIAKQNGKEKLLSVLSVDQMALILRASDDLKIIMARSLNNVFKQIVPYLSTPYQENISYDSMRSKSYAAESRDKEIAIETLERIIEKIKEY